MQVADIEILVMVQREMDGVGIQSPADRSGAGVFCNQLCDTGIEEDTIVVHMYGKCIEQDLTIEVDVAVIDPGARFEMKSCQTIVS